MSSVTRPRGPLPARVYWTRRLLFLGLALGLVFGISQLTGESPEKSASPTARPAAAPQTSPTNGRTPAVGSTKAPAPMETKTADKKKAGNKKGKKKVKKKVKPPPAVPTGPCDDSDVRIEPTVDGLAYAGRDITITLNLTTLRSPACTWQVSPKSVVLKLTSGSDRIWSTQDCPGAIDPEQVVLRKASKTKVKVVWSGQRSDDECSRTTLWAEPGYYHAASAALGAEPVDHQFRLLSPPRPTITKTPEPKPDQG